MALGTDSLGTTALAAAARATYTDDFSTNPLTSRLSASGWTWDATSQVLRQPNTNTTSKFAHHVEWPHSSYIDFSVDMKIESDPAGRRHAGLFMQTTTALDGYRITNLDNTFSISRYDGGTETFVGITTGLVNAVTIAVGTTYRLRVVMSWNAAGMTGSVYVNGIEHRSFSSTVNTYTQARPGYHNYGAQVSYDNAVYITGAPSEAPPPPVTAYVAEVLADKPSLYYKLDETTGAAAVDSSGNNRYGAYVGSYARNQGPLISDSAKAVQFAAGGYVNSNYSPGNLADLTYEAWIKTPSTLSGTQVILGRHIPDNADSALLMVGGKIQMANFAGTFAGPTAPTALAPSTIYHVVGRRLGGVNSVWINGQKVAEGTATRASVGNAPVHVGSWQNGQSTFLGTMDEVAFYGSALSDARISAHYIAAFKVTGQAASAQATGASGVSTTGIQISGEGAGTWATGASGMDMSGVRIAGEAASVQATGASGVDATGVQISGEPAVAQANGLSMAVPLVISGEPAVATADTSAGLAYQILIASPADIDLIQLSSAGGLALVQVPMNLTILEADTQAPMVLTVAVEHAVPDVNIDFSIDGTLVSTVNAGPSGEISVTTIPVDESFGAVGTHTLTIDQVGQQSDSATFELTTAPELVTVPLPPPTPVVDIPGYRANGTRLWVLQDPAPDGLGSYIMPVSPSEMESPAFERILTSKHTTAKASGRHHIYEAGQRPVEWGFAGYCPTQEMHDAIKAFGALNHRFYLIDHRGRCWTVAFSKVEMTARLRQDDIYGDPSDWVHDYHVSGLIYDQEPVYL